MTKNKRFAWSALCGLLASVGAGCDPGAAGVSDEETEFVASAATACATKLTPTGATASSIQDNNQTYENRRAGSFAMPAW